MSARFRFLAPFTLIITLISLGLFALGIVVMENTQAWRPALAVALPAILLAAIGMALAIWILKTKPSGKTYAFAMIGSLTGGFSILFWVVMVPMMLLIAYPARQIDPDNPLIAQSEKQMVILVRHIKTFEQEFGRLPVRLEEMIDAGYIQPHLLYDPRQRKRDAVSYRLMVQELPPVTQWSSVPILEGRIPDEDGKRLCAFANETTGILSPNSSGSP